MNKHLEKEIREMRMFLEENWGEDLSKAIITPEETTEIGL